MDIHAISYDLLERLANSLYDRGINKNNPISFNCAEIAIVENFINEILCLDGRGKEEENHGL